MHPSLILKPYTALDTFITYPAPHTATHRPLVEGRRHRQAAGAPHAQRGARAEHRSHLETTFFGGRGVGRVSVRESSIKNTELRSQNRTTCNQCCADKAVCTKDEVYTRDSGDSVGLRTHSQPHRFMQVVAAQGLTAPLRPLMHSVAFPISRFSS